MRDSGERDLAGWTVELYRDTLLSQSVLTDANGDYVLVGVEPNDVNAIRYDLVFRAPGAGPSTAMLGLAASPFTNGLQQISDIIVASGAIAVGLNLPIQPNGVVYDSVARIPIAGATLTLLDAASGSALPSGCLDDAAQQGQVTLADGRSSDVPPRGVRRRRLADLQDGDLRHTVDFRDVYSTVARGCWNQQRGFGQRQVQPLAFIAS